MTNGDRPIPVWTLTTADGTAVPALPVADRMSSGRLAQLRAALAAFADNPVVTLEAHAMPKELDRSRGIPLDAASPLAHHLAHLINTTAKSVPAAAGVETAGEVLYRMVVPAKVAAQVGTGLVRPMVSKTAVSGIHSAMMDASGIVAQATFVPVAASEAAAAGAAGGAGATAAAATASAGALTVAAPLVLMAVAVGVSAYADHKRQQAIEHLTTLLEKLHEDRLDDERSHLDGCRDAIDKATAILLDHGTPGHSLGLDSAVHAISGALVKAERRLDGWRAALDGLPCQSVEVGALDVAFRGVGKEGGQFRAHLELARLAIALKRRVLVLQAVEHGQSDEGNPFQNFVRSLQADQHRVDDLENGIASVLRRLGSLHVLPPSGIWHGTLMTRGEVDQLLRSADLVRELGDTGLPSSRPADLVIDMARTEDGSVVVFPAVAI